MIASAISPGDHSVVSAFSHYSVGSPYFGLRQCQGRSPISGSDSDYSVSGTLHRMVSRPQDSHPPLQFVGNTYSRSVRYQAEQQGRGILLTLVV